MKLPEPWTFFVDRSLGYEDLPSALRRAEVQVQVHDDHFPHDTPDVEWLAEVGRRGWVVLTKDKEIRRNAQEFQVVREARVACFQLGSGNASGRAAVVAFTAAMPRIYRALRRFAPPLVAGVSLLGGVRLLFVDGAWLAPPKELK